MDGTDVDDGSAAGGERDRQGLRKQKWSTEIDGHYTIEGGGGNLAEGEVKLDAGIVDQDIDLWREAGQACGKHIDGCGLGEIGDEEIRCAAGAVHGGGSGGDFRPHCNRQAEGGRHESVTLRRWLARFPVPPR